MIILLPTFRTVWPWKASQLVVHRFSSRTLGLASSRPGLKQILFASSTPAVCVPPGARLLLQDIPEHLQERLGCGCGRRSDLC